MQRDEIDVMWQQALRDSVKDGEMFTRYHFAEMVSAKEREACAVIAEESFCGCARGCCSVADSRANEIANAIRARGEA